MIEQMKKISLVMLDANKKEALKTLRKLGVVHLETVEGHSEELSTIKENYSTVEDAVMYLNDVKVPKKSNISQENLSTEEGILKAEEIVKLYETQKDILEQKTNDIRELERFQLWGGVNPEDFAFLKTKGIVFSMYEIPTDKYKTIPEEINTLKINGNKTQTRFLAFCNEGEKIENMPSEAYSVPLPTLSTNALKNNIANYDKQLAEFEAEKIKLTCYKEALQNVMKTLEKEVEFENFYSGIDKDTEGKHPLCWLTGYVPTADLPKVVEVAKAEKWAYLADDPSEEDEVPTKLKNNKFVSLIYPISDFLGTVPGYREYDISGWFLLFFCVFFGMIFGDGGYGLLLTVAGLGGIFAGLAKKKAPGSAMYLLLLLGLSTTAWGALTCNWFGILPEDLPGALKNIAYALDWDFISNASSLGPDMVKQNLQIFCFSLALIQLSVAHIKGIKRFIKSPKALAEFGSLILLWGIYYVVLNMVVSGERFTMGNGVKISMELCVMDIKILAALIGGGFLLTFVFANYEGSIGKSILESCKNIVSVLLGVVNQFSDIVSYIRLWAVGLAGSAIAQTVNEMAGPMLGGFIICFGILLLGFGHGLNMILNVLSVIVHGVRLNTLEFSSHLGMSWSGFSYKPFNEGK